MTTLVGYAKPITQAAVNGEAAKLLAAFKSMGCNEEHAAFITETLISAARLDNDKANAGIRCTIELQGQVETFLTEIQTNHAQFLARGVSGTSILLGTLLKVNLSDAYQALNYRPNAKETTEDEPVERKSKAGRKKKIAEILEQPDMERVKTWLQRRSGTPQPQLSR